MDKMIYPFEMNYIGGVGYLRATLSVVVGLKDGITDISYNLFSNIIWVVVGLKDGITDINGLKFRGNELLWFD